MNDTYYRLSDGRVWSTAQARFIEPDTIPDNAEITGLISAEGRSDDTYLAETLAFYGYPLGNLALLSPVYIRKRLAELDAQYLPPRTLAGLAVNDPYALEQWQAHEREAEPLRQKLEELERLLQEPLD